MTTSEKTETTEQKRPDCWSCHYFAISWDPRMPYSCKLMGFKSKITPCLEVVSADGRICMGFTPKTDMPLVQPIERKPSKPKLKPRRRLVNLRV